MATLKRICGTGGGVEFLSLSRLELCFECKLKALKANLSMLNKETFGDVGIEANVPLEGVKCLLKKRGP